MTYNDAIRRLPTRINGLDQVALGGLPEGRSTLVTGTTGTGKTLFAIEFLARGIQHLDQPGVFVNFEERPEDVRRNAASLSFPIEQWERDRHWAFVDATADAEDGGEVIVGNYDFGGLASRIEHAVRGIGAVRVSLDSLGAVFSRFPNSAVVRQELHRIAHVLNRIGVTSVITAERTSEYNGVSRYDVEEFVLDNVIILRNVLADERRRRTVEIVKFRGTTHRTGEWLFTIDPKHGIVVMPLAFLTPLAVASRTRVSTGNPGLDEMCGGGVYQDSIVLLTGPSGVGKTLTGLGFTAAGIAAGERCLIFALDESRAQLGRNAAGWGLDLDSMEASGLLRIVCDYPEVASLEDHFLRLRQLIEEFQPTRLVMDTLSALERVVTPRALLDFVLSLGAVVRQHRVTTLLTSAPSGRFTPQLTPAIAAEIASLTDVSINLRYVESAGEIHRVVAVLQTRGSMHDPSIRHVTVDSEGLHVGERVTRVVGILSGNSTIPGVPWLLAESPEPEEQQSGE
ncbi:circadian clock protein KaiC [Kutzneria buriramensis]|uniref:non-specific serine/threonine protein kinase n=1 Tax=Kutzneria buriramensis TaxID=1045776 RepID=A0A3E0I5E5_9PSEU|nr:circadian clock protein KaiC [Kutzneria buriramensis]REH53953.1 circadian clock protein KaiC [Kutzneria buriramensis]